MYPKKNPKFLGVLLTGVGLYFVLTPNSAGLLISEFTLQFRPGYKINRPEVTLIRIAYLLAFAQFGYGFLISHNLMHVRHQIQNSAEKFLPD